MKIDLDFAEDVVLKALKSGAEQAEVFIRCSKNISVEIKNQSVDSLKSSSSSGYSLRVIKGNRLGFSYSTDINEYDSVIKNAVEAADFTDTDIYTDLPEASGMTDVEVFDPELGDIREQDAIERTKLLERYAYDEDERIRKIRKAAGSFTFSETSIVNSKKIRANYFSTSCSAQIMAVAEHDDDSRIGWDFEGSRFLHDISFEEIGRNAARRALNLLGSRKIQGLRTDVILDNSVAVDFLGIFASSLSSESVQKGKSLLKDKLNTKVISSKLNIMDSGLLSGKLGSRPVDDEGVPVTEKKLIEEGMLRTYLFNTYTAKKSGTVSTGNAVRRGFSSLPTVGTTNFYLGTAPGVDTFPKDEMFRIIDRGLYIVEAMGVHTANPISGEFSIGVAGLWIERGVMQFPVKEAVISGNIMELFNKVEAVGDDLRFYGNLGAPCLIISDVDISA
ncbi:MAG: TldD/PmbA family protein [Nitrospirota bacterium]